MTAGGEEKPERGVVPRRSSYFLLRYKQSTAADKGNFVTQQRDMKIPRSAWTQAMVENVVEMWPWRLPCYFLCVSL